MFPAGYTHKNALPKRSVSSRTISDYSPFGVLLPERSVNAGDFRYGYNGKEKVDEIKGEGNSYDFGARMYDPRIGRWLSRDPLERKYADISPYVFVGNMPIIAIDPNGKEIIISMSDEQFAKQTFSDLQKLTNAKLVLMNDGHVYEYSSLPAYKRSAIAVEGNNNPAPLKLKLKPFGTRFVHNIINDDETVTIVKQAEGEGNVTEYNPVTAAPEGEVFENNGTRVGTGTGSDATIKYDPKEKGLGIVNADGTTGRSPHIGLAHELGHALRAMRGKLTQKYSPNATDPDNPNSRRGLSKEEIRNRKEVDNVIRNEQGEKKRAVPIEEE